MVQRARGWRGKLGPVWRQLQPVVPSGLCWSVCWASREGGLCLHKLHTAELQKRRMKTKMWLWRISSFVAAALKCTPELCVPCAPPPTPTLWLALSELGAIYFFSGVTKDFCRCFDHVAGFSANQLILSETFQDLMQINKMAKCFKNQQRRDIFQPKEEKKKVNLTSDFKKKFSLLFFLHASEQCETYLSLVE